MFIHHHKVQFYETDLMGIVHHSNYLRFYEEARVAWAHSKGLISYQNPSSANHFAVYETQVKHRKPTFFGDDLQIEVRAKSVGNRLVFEYRMLGRGNEVCSVAQTIHVPLGSDLKLQRLSAEIKAATEGELWIETWL